MIGDRGVSAADGGLDAVDLAFVRRLPRSQPTTAAIGAASGPGPERPRTGAREPSVAAIADRLLAAVPDTWIGLAQRIEERHRAGSVVFAVAGGQAVEGRTTIVECLARSLAARGNTVEIVAAAPAEIPVPRSGRPSQIVLVDAGVWFPAGPLRRGWLQRRSFGCHAVILVRRSDALPCPQRGPACAAVGLDVLGEIVTMVPVSATAGDPCDAA